MTYIRQKHRKNRVFYVFYKKIANCYGFFLDIVNYWWYTANEEINSDRLYFFDWRLARRGG